MFWLGLAIFFGAHVFTMQRGARAGLVARLGEKPYKGLYSLVALAGFVLIILGWPSASADALYVTPYWLRHVAFLLVPIGFVLLAAAYVPSGRIAAAAKHPMLAAVKIWAFAHLLVNGEVRSVALFGAFLAYAVVDRIAVKRRGEPTPPPGPVRNDLIAVGVGVAASAATFLWFHPAVLGVPLIG